MDLTNVVWRKARRSSANGGDCVEIAAVPVWRKARRSGENGGNCVEVANVTVWQKTRRSGENGGMCVEVAAVPEHIAVRDSKDPEGPKLVFGREAWRVFAAGLKEG